MNVQTIIQTNTKPKAHHHPIKLMGCGFVLTAVDRNPQKAWDAIRAGVQEIERIETLISSWKEGSETSEINRQAGIRSVEVSPELFDLIARSIKISVCTAGAFDICGTLSRYYWKFDKQEHKVLSSDKIQELRGLIDYRYIELNPSRSSVFLKKKGMKIGFGGIGKGYAAYRAQQVMQSLGIESGLINASGDLMCWGKPPDEAGWTVNIPHPQNRNQNLLSCSLPYGAVVTSGNYENYTIIDGKRYSHIVDPRTGFPVVGIKHVTVVCPNPEFADAMATAISVLGAEDGINLINRLNGIECVVIDKDDNIHYSKQFKNFGL